MGAALKLDLTPAEDDELTDAVARGEALAECALEDSTSAENAGAALACALGLLCRAQGLNVRAMCLLARLVYDEGGGR